MTHQFKTHQEMNTTIETKRLIAKFMNYANNRPLANGLLKSLYNDWNSLMEVVEKIESIEVNTIRYIDFHIMPDAVIVTNQEDEENPLILINKSEGKGSIETEPILFETKIEAVYKACVEFIKWYNENK